MAPWSVQAAQVCPCRAALARTRGGLPGRGGVLGPTMAPSSGASEGGSVEVSHAAAVGDRSCRRGATGDGHGGGGATAEWAHPVERLYRRALGHGAPAPRLPVQPGGLL